MGCASGVGSPTHVAGNSAKVAADTCTPSIKQMRRMQRTADARPGILSPMESEREAVTSKSLPTSAVQEVADCREQIAAEAEAISRPSRQSGSYEK
jgi:hypothetical protein